MRLNRILQGTVRSLQYVIMTVFSDVGRSAQLAGRDPASPNALRLYVWLQYPFEAFKLVR